MKTLNFIESKYGNVNLKGNCGLKWYEIIELLREFDRIAITPHVHHAGSGKNIDTCKWCGKDIRNEIHISR